MDFARDLLLFIHLLGFASLLGGALVQARDQVQVVNSAMLHGALVQVVSGLLLVGVLLGQDTDVDEVKVATKLAVALVIAVLCWVNRRKQVVPSGLFAAILFLTVLDAGIAVFW